MNNRSILTGVKVLSCLLAYSLIQFSCKIKEKEIAGFYRLKRAPKTTLKINSDKTFELTRINRNPYLHPFDHPEEYFLITKGHWLRVDKNTVSLTSRRDTLIYPLEEVQIGPAANHSMSDFTFYDKYCDTVKILYVQYTDSTITTAFHRSLSGYSVDLSKRDTLEFHFYGYRPYTFVSDKRKNHNYSILLKPAFQPSFFNGHKFKIKRRSLIDFKANAKFKR